MCKHYLSHVKYTEYAMDGKFRQVACDIWQKQLVFLASYSFTARRSAVNYQLGVCQDGWLQYNTNAVFDEVSGCPRLHATCTC